MSHLRAKLVCVSDDDSAASGDEWASSWRDHLVSADHQASRDYDRTVTTLASGALAISLVFIHDVAPHPGYIGWVVAAWGGFGLSLLLILASFLTSMDALRSEIRALDENRDTDLTFSTTTTMRLNRGAMVALVLGVVCLVLFAGLNL